MKSQGDSSLRHGEWHRRMIRRHHPGETKDMLINEREMIVNTNTPALLCRLSFHHCPSGEIKSQVILKHHYIQINWTVKFCSILPQRSRSKISSLILFRWRCSHLLLIRFKELTSGPGFPGSPLSPGSPGRPGNPSRPWTILWHRKDI